MRLWQERLLGGQVRVMVEIKSVPKIVNDGEEESFAICSDVGYHDDDVVEKCDECGCTIYLRPETSVMTNKICTGCFRVKLKNGEIPEEDLKAYFTDASRKELSKALGREVSVGEVVDLVLKEFR